MVGFRCHGCVVTDTVRWPVTDTDRVVLSVGVTATSPHAVHARCRRHGSAITRQRCLPTMPTTRPNHLLVFSAVWCRVSSYQNTWHVRGSERPTHVRASRSVIQIAFRSTDGIYEDRDALHGRSRTAQGTMGQCIACRGALCMHTSLVETYIRFKQRSIVTIAPEIALIYYE